MDHEHIERFSMQAALAMFLSRAHRRVRRRRRRLGPLVELVRGDEARLPPVRS
jgi:hypothetical protein